MNGWRATNGWRAACWRAAWIGGALLALAATGASAQLAVEMKLANAGFTMRIASTPRELERIRAIPARRFVMRTTNGVRHYLYADPSGCQCVLVGSERAMRSYRDMVAPPPPPPGVRELGGGPTDVGVNPMGEIIHDMHDDLDAVDVGDILHFRF